VVCADVLEHLREPAAVLDKIRSWLAPDGVLVASFPNAQHFSVVGALLDGNWTYEQSGLLDRDHVRFFTRREIEKLFYRAGFEIASLAPRPGTGLAEWQEAGRPTSMVVGTAHVSGLTPASAEALFAYQYLVTARPRPRVEYPLTSIILLTYNQLPFTMACVNSILMRTDEAYELIVVDNGSSDGTADYLRGLRGARVVYNPENRGFPVAANQGIRLSQGANIVLLNNDTMVTTGWLRRLLDALDIDSRIGLAGPCSNCVSGAQQVPVGYRDLSSLDGFAWEWAKEHSGILEDTHRLIGFCLAMKRNLVEQIGVLDERFEIGCFEDDDYCLRAIQAGWRAVIAREAFVHHFGSRTFLGSGVDFSPTIRENRLKFVKKWTTLQSVDGSADAAPPSAIPSRPSPPGA
jgi:GT2 family glycosyltransferase